MKLSVTFKHLPAAGKLVKSKSFRWGKTKDGKDRVLFSYNLYTVAYNSKGSYNAPGNKHRQYILPKWLWKRL